LLPTIAHEFARPDAAKTLMAQLSSSASPVLRQADKMNRCPFVGQYT
jgi:hypothetical protein